MLMGFSELPWVCSCTDADTCEKKKKNTTAQHQLEKGKANVYSNPGKFSDKRMARANMGSASTT